MTQVQQITPELLQWIAAQARAGHKQGSVLEAMRMRGWHDEAALAAMEQSLRGSQVEPPPPAAVPEPDPHGTACILGTADREVRVLASLRLPRVMVFGDLLSHEECDRLIELARPRLVRSTTIDNWSGGSELSPVRTSDGMFFARGENDILRKVEARIAELLKWPVECGEDMQVLRYAPGAEYQPHHDYFDPTVPGGGSIIDQGGQRVATLLMYLKTPPRGGATIFPDVGLQVTPCKGNAVFFSYDRPHPATRTLHGGAPAIHGEKWVATKWLRAKLDGRTADAFRSLTIGQS